MRVRDALFGSGQDSRHRGRVGAPPPHARRTGDVRTGHLAAGQLASLREPLGKFFTTLPEVKAAWLFCEEEPKPPFEQVYVVGLAIVGGDAEEIRREAALALAGLCPPNWGSRAIIMDPQDPGFSDIMRCPSFYRTADYVPPAEAKPHGPPPATPHP